MRPHSPAGHAVRSVVIATLALAATGCGQKGALYLPDRGGEVVTRPMQTPAEATTTEAPPAPGDEPGPEASTPKPQSEPPR